MSIIDRLRLFIRTYPLTCLCLTNAASLLYLARYLSRQNGGLLKSITQLLFSSAKHMPGAKAVLAKENAKMLAKLEKMVIREFPEGDRCVRVPDRGWASSLVLDKLQQWYNDELDIWSTGRVSGAVYHAVDQSEQGLTAVTEKAMTLFMLSNPLHPDLFPCIRKMESEVVRMCVNLFRGDDEACGTMTSGGTESILMACKAYRDYYLDRRGVTEPEIVASSTVHAAFDKACHYFGIKLVKVGVREDFTADTAAMGAAITPNTIFLVGSAVSFPNGTMDDIIALSTLAIRHNIGLHVDACLGGFVLCFMEQAGFQVSSYDFRVPGVTSLSADTHKYGCAPKGSSVLLFRHLSLRRAQYFIAGDWTGGIYATPTIAGSRPGCLIAACWAAMVTIGMDGYVARTKTLIDTRRSIEARLRAIADIQVLGKPVTTVVSFTVHPNAKNLAGKALNIYNIGDAMTSRGWSLNTLQFPGALHLCVTGMHGGSMVEVFIADLLSTIEEVKQHPDKFKDGVGAIYGLAESIPDRSMVSDLAASFVDVLYKAV